jgi:GxxExxY protein
MEQDVRTYAIIGAAMAVHRELGSGFSESIYGAAITVEMTGRKIPFAREVKLPVFYQGQPLNAFYRADFICYVIGNNLRDLHDCQIMLAAQKASRMGG